MYRQLMVFIAIGLIVTIAGAIVQPWIVFQIYSDAEVREIVSGVHKSSLYFGSAMATATATLLGLMLTLLSLTQSASESFKDLYRRVKAIAVLAVSGFLLSVLQLTILSFPLGEFSSVPDGWFQALFFLISTMNFIIIGFVTTLTLALTEAIFRAIHQLSPHSTKSG